jgi:hypothetical protein
MSHSRHQHFILPLIVALLLGACATSADRLDNLNRTLLAYEKAVRWAKFDIVYSFHKWDTDEQPSLPARLKNIRVTGYEVVNSRFDEKTMITTQLVAIRYYNTDTLRERELEGRQRWKYFPEPKRWYLLSDPLTFP